MHLAAMGRDEARVVNGEGVGLIPNLGEEWANGGVGQGLQWIGVHAN